MKTLSSIVLRLSDTGLRTSTCTRMIWTMVFIKMNGKMKEQSPSLIIF